MEKFELSKVTRNKCIGWAAKGSKLPDGSVSKGQALITSMFMNDDDTVNVSKAAEYSLKPEQVVYLTPADLNPAYTQGVKAAMEYHAKECDMSKDDLVYKLIVADAMQDAANKSVAAFRPVTDKAKERAYSTMVKLLEASGKTKEQIEAALIALK